MFILLSQNHRTLLAQVLGNKPEQTIPGNEKATLPKMKTPSKKSNHRETNSELRLSQWFSFRLSELVHLHMHDLLAVDMFNGRKRRNINFSWVSEEMLLYKDMQ